MCHLAAHGPAGMQLGPDLGAKEARYTYKDAFGNQWTWDKNAGGACMTPGTRVCDDILKWEEQIHFPDYHEFDLAESAAEFMAKRYDPSRVLHIDIYHGPFQALSDLLGGFAEQEYLPQGLEGTKFYEPGNTPRENDTRNALRSRWQSKYNY